MSKSNNLLSDNLHKSIPKERDIFGSFIGKWSLDLTIYDLNRNHESYKGEWHFFRILQGLAIQDIWIIPGFHNSGKHDFHEYGTTVRKFNPKKGNWTAVWIGPIQDQLFVFDIEDNEETIILTKNGNSKLEMKWTFFDIMQSSFQWKSEVKLKGIDNWFTNYHMTLSRIEN